jgi:hypothetical protein
MMNNLWFVAKDYGIERLTEIMSSVTARLDDGGYLLLSKEGFTSDRKDATMNYFSILRKYGKTMSVDCTHAFNDASDEQEIAISKKLFRSCGVDNSHIEQLLSETKIPDWLR